MAFTIPGFSIGISADADPLIKELRKVSETSARTAREVQAQGSTMSRSMTTGFSAATTAVNALRTSLLSLVGVLGVRELAQFTAASFRAAGDLGEMALAAGVTTRELQILQLAAVQSGASQEQLSTSLARLGRGLAEATLGTGSLRGTLKQYGIAVKDAEGNTRSSYEVLGDLAEAVQNASSQSEQLRIAQVALGRGGAALVPILAEGREGLEKWASAAERAGLILGPAFIQRADDAGDAVATLQYAVSKGFQVGLIEAFNVEVGGTDGQLRQAAEAGQQFGTIVGGVMNMLTPMAQQLAAEFEDINTAFGYLESGAKKITDALGITYRNAEEARQKLAELEVQRAATAEYAVSIGERPESMFAVQEADRQIAAMQSVIDEMEGVHRATVPVIDIYRDATDATNEFTASTVKLAGEQARLADAGKFLTETSAQEERLAAAGDATKKRLDWQRQEALKMTREGHEAVEKLQRDNETMAEAFAGPLVDASPAVQATVVATFMAVWS